MNEIHLQRLASSEWQQYLESELVPWVLGITDLGDDVLEVGPGPGLTTDLLREKVDRLTAVEVDPELAERLARRLAGTNVDVLSADATALDLASARFSTATCFTMLHHVPSPILQDQLFSEMHRVLRRGGHFIGTDAIDTPPLRAIHVDDVFVPVDPETLPRRLVAAGFTDVFVETNHSLSPITGQPGARVRFDATKPIG
jgi:SAM-dependent methyltransferase